MATLLIRRAEIGDASRVTRLHAASWAEVFDSSSPYPSYQIAEQKWHDVLRSGAIHVLLAETETESCGFIAIDGIGEITDLFVSPARRRSGIAACLIEHLIEQLQPRTKLSLWVAETNHAARRLYERFDFEIAEDRKSDPRRIDGTDLIRMRRSAKMA